MPDNDRYGDWLQEFRREVDEDLAARSPAPAPAPSAGSPPAPEALEAMQNAVDRFEDWWRNESSELGAEPDPGGEAEQVNKELDLSRREVLALREELGRLRTGTDVPVRQGAEEARRQQAEERARLLQRAAELEADNEALRRREHEARLAVMCCRQVYQKNGRRPHFSDACSRPAFSPTRRTTGWPPGPAPR